MEFISYQSDNFRSNLPRFSWNFSFQANLDEKLIFSIFEMIYGFFSYLRMDSN